MGVELEESRPWAAIGDPMVIRRWKVTDEDTIDGVELTATAPQLAGHYVLAHRATSGRAAWQATWFDDRGPGGDVRRQTLEEALNDQAPPSQYKLSAVHMKGERMKTNPRVEAQAVRWHDVAEYIYRAWKQGYSVDSAAAHAPWPEGALRRSDYMAAVLTLRVPERYAGRVWEEAQMLVGDRFDDFVDNPRGAPPARASAAIDKYREFHRKEPKVIGEFSSDFYIPTHVLEVGAAKNVLYRSDKIDPETLQQPERPINYIHDHDPGVCVYEPCGEDDGDATEVPFWIIESEALVLLGTCLGFAFQPDGGELVEARVRAPRPQLYTTACGRALLVIQSKRKVLAMMWGGSLGVEDRGIVG